MVSNAREVGVKRRFHKRLFGTEWLNCLRDSGGSIQGPSFKELLIIRIMLLTIWSSIIRKTTQTMPTGGRCYFFSNFDPCLHLKLHSLPFFSFFVFLFLSHTLWPQKYTILCYTLTNHFWLWGVYGWDARDRTVVRPRLEWKANVWPLVPLLRPHVCLL